MASLENYKIALGGKIRRCRIASGMSLRSFGLMTGVHYNQLLAIEKGKANPSLETLHKISSGLDMELFQLLDCLE